MKTSKVLLTLILIISITINCSCTRSYNEIESRAFILGVGFDYDPISKQYLVSAEAVEGQPSRGFSSPAPKIIIGRGKSIFDAVRNMIKTFGKRMYWAHAKVLIINGNIAKNGIYEVLDWVNRDQEVRDDMIILFTSKDTAQKILETKKSENTINSNVIHDMMKSQPSAPYYPKLDLWDFLYDIATPGIEPIGAMIRLNPYEKGTLQIGGTAVFSGNIMKGSLSDDQTRILQFIRDKIKDGLFHLGKEQTTVKADITFEIFKSKTKLKPVHSKGAIAMIVDVNTEVGVAESSADLDFSNAELLKQLKGDLEAELKEEIQTLVAQVKSQYEADIFGFGREINIHMPKEWKSLKSDWNINFTNLEVSANVNVHIIGSAIIAKPLHSGDYKYENYAYNYILYPYRCYGN